jgi:hypothetical protein
LLVSVRRELAFSLRLRGFSVSIRLCFYNRPFHMPAKEEISSEKEWRTQLWVDIRIRPSFPRCIHELWRRVLIDKLIETWMIKKFLVFVEPGYSQLTVSGSYLRQINLVLSTTPL